jgi:transposase InsO family protein
MAQQGWVGALRGCAPRPRSPAGRSRPEDLVDRDFTDTVPNQLWVADFTYVATWASCVVAAREATHDGLLLGHDDEVERQLLVGDFHSARDSM